MYDKQHQRRHRDCAHVAKEQTLQRQSLENTKLKLSKKKKKATLPFPSSAHTPKATIINNTTTPMWLPCKSENAKNKTTILSSYPLLGIYLFNEHKKH